ncbi:MAG TPA: hypothetical protein IAB62_00795 [Candidatus Coprocola pullicola]|nr:hypothetical protein [Candidatus Coprocola pullicola]
MSWQTSKGFVSPQQRIAKIEAVPVLSGYQTSGAIVKYASKYESSSIAVLTEGSFASDFVLEKDDKNKKMLIDTTVKKDIDKLEEEDTVLKEIQLPEGVLAWGISDGCNEALTQLEEKNVLVFWYNGNWNIVKKDNLKQDYIPIALAEKVINSMKIKDTSSILKGLKKEKLKNMEYASVSAEELAYAMGIKEELYSKWVFHDVVHIMLNTDMYMGPYQLKRMDGTITVTFYTEYKNKNNFGDEYISVEGIQNNAMGAYFMAITEGFKKWNIKNPQKSHGELAGLGEYDIHFVVNIDTINQKKKHTAMINVINTYDKYTKNKQISHVSNTQWKINHVGIMTMYSFFGDNAIENRYTREQYMQVAAHEFGHLLGIGDAYEENGVAKIQPTEEVPMEDIMRGGSVITYNHIEMIFLAALKNEKQYFDSSEAITEGCI